MCKEESTGSRLRREAGGQRWQERGDGGMQKMTWLALSAYAGAGHMGKKGSRPGRENRDTMWRN